LSILLFLYFSGFVFIFLVLFLGIICSGDISYSDKESFGIYKWLIFAKWSFMSWFAFLKYHKLEDLISDVYNNISS